MVQVSFVGIRAADLVLRWRIPGDFLAKLDWLATTMVFLSLVFAVLAWEKPGIVTMWAIVFYAFLAWIGDASVSPLVSWYAVVVSAFSVGAWFACVILGTPRVEQWAEDLTQKLDGFRRREEG